jgi:phage/plasmid-like protein (TIGR03299 family)
MASGITENDSMFYVRQTPWHGMGVRVEEALTSEEALRISGLDWRVEQVPVFYGEGHALTDEYRANIRDDTRDLLGIVSDQYQICQNAEAFAFTDQLLGEGVRYETAGSLFGGRKTWLLARMEQVTILGDQVDPYLLFSNGHDGYNAVKVAITPTRVVCNNTLTAALKGAKRIWTTKHRGDMISKLEQARMTLANANQYMEILRLKAEEFASLILTSAQVGEYIESLFPIDEIKATARVRNNAIELREDFRARLAAPDLANFRNSAYALFNAAADFAGHREPSRKSANWQENRLARVIDGDPFMERAQLLLNCYIESR